MPSVVLKAVTQLGETLALEPDFEKVSRVLSRCPRIVTDPDSELQWKRLLSDFKDVRRTGSVLAIQKFLILSKGKFAEDLMKWIIEYVRFLPQVPVNEINSLGRFPTQFMVQLAGILEILANKDLAQEVVDVVLIAIETLVTDEKKINMLTLIMTALGESKLPLTDDQIKKLVPVLLKLLQKQTTEKIRVSKKKKKSREKDNLENKASIKIKILALKVLEQITYLPAIDKNTELVTELFETATNHAGTLQTLQPAIDIVIRCGLLNSALDSKSSSFLISELLDTVPAYGDNMELNKNHYVGLLKGITSLSLKYPSKIASFVESILQFLLENLVLLKDQDNAIRDQGISCICDIAQNEIEKRGINGTRWILDTLSNNLFTLHSVYVTFKDRKITEGDKFDEKRIKEYQLVVVVLTLGRITCRLNNPTVTDLVLPILINRITYPELTFDAFIIDQLTDIALLAQTTAYETVVDLLTNIYRNCLNYLDNIYILNTIPKGLLKLAEHLNNEKLLQDLLLRMLKLFQILADQIHRKDEKHRIGLIEFLAILLPTLAELSTRLETNTLHSNHLKLFRDFWFYCVIYRFCDAETTKNAKEMKKIAAKMPPLVSKHSTLLETIIKLDSLAKQGIQYQEYFKKLISDILAQSQAKSFIFTVDLVKNLSQGECLYLVSVYYLESLRVHHGNLECIFHYLEEQSIQQSPTLYQPIQNILDQVFGLYLNNMKERASTIKPSDTPIHISSSIALATSTEQKLPTSTRELTSICELLLVNFINSEVSVRKSADKYILQLLENFPHLLWNKNSLKTLLDLTQEVAKGCDVQGHASLRFKIPHSNLTILLPEDYTSRITLVKDITRLCTVWLSSARKEAPVETGCLLQEYFRQYQKLSLGFLNHAGFSIAVEMGSISETKETKGQEVENNFVIRQSAASFVNSLNLKATYFGEVIGIIDTMKMLKSDPATLADIFVQKLKSSIELYRRGGLKISVYNGDLCRATAYIIAQPKCFHNELIHYICWTPIVLFSIESIQTGVFVWSWLLAVRPELELHILSELKEAWEWSIYQQFGLFNQSQRDPSPLSIPKQKVKNNSPNDEIFKEVCFTTTPNLDSEPHRLLLDFFYERFIIVRNTSTIQMDIIQSILLKSIEDPKKLSIQPQSLATRFRLLLFCLHFTQFSHQKPQCQFLRTLFMDRIFDAAYSWFFHSPIWYDPGNRKPVQESVKILLEFCKCIEESNIQSKNQFSLPSLIENREITGPNIIFKVLDVAVKESKTVGRGSLPSILDTNLLLDKSYKYPKEKISLLLLLVGHEIDRIATWHNPQNRIIFQFPNESKFSPEKILNSTQWRKYIRTAWSIAPRLALILGERFPSPKIRSALDQLIVENVKITWKEPSSVLFLASQSNVLANIPELKYLIYWAPTSPPTALTLLGKEYKSNQYVTQYAVRVLRSYPPDTILFYLPQLVQTLRYDQSGLVENYLLNVAKQSQMLAHQLIWNAQTYFKDTDKCVNPLSFKVRKLHTQIIEHFTPYARTNYENEFEFFDKVTSISGILKPFDKAERRQILKDELKKIDIKGLLYLPTNPDTTVLRINPEKASPMQSAAKVPILVSFLVSSIPALSDIMEAEIIAPIAKKGAKSKSKRLNDTQIDFGSEAQLSEKISLSQTLDVNLNKEKKEIIAKNKAKFDDASKKEQLKQFKRTRSEIGIKDAILPKAVVTSDENLSLGTLKTKKRAGSFSEETHWQACIFKVGDDVRQDMLALQITDLFKRIFENVGLPLYLFPYRVVATSDDCGIIECVPNAKSRDQLGKQVEGSLYDYFLHRYGSVNTIEFQNARNNFLSSMAAYSIISYILQIKDRHNGNMLIDDLGHIVHIDFGFIFDISPGGNVKFERAPFKLSDEMLSLMGGPESEPFKWFMEYMTKGYLACREHMESIITLVSLMLDTQFPCFTEQTIANLRVRFAYDKSEREAAKFMTYLIIDGLSAFSSYTTKLYDVFQHWSNGIDY